MAYLQPGEPVPRRGSGWGAGWWIVLVIIIAFIIWAVGWGWNRGVPNRAAAPPAAENQNQIGHVNNSSTQTTQVQSVDDITGAQNPIQLVDRSVRLDNVKVQATAGKRAFWIGDNPNQRVLVVLSREAQEANQQLPQSGASPSENRAGQRNTAPEQAQPPQQGEQVSIGGVVQAIQSPQQVEQQYGIPLAQTRNLHGQQVYILANELTPAGGNE